MSKSSNQILNSRRRFPASMLIGTGRWGIGIDYWSLRLSDDETSLINSGKWHIYNNGISLPPKARFDMPTQRASCSAFIKYLYEWRRGNYIASADDKKLWQLSFDIIKELESEASLLVRQRQAKNKLADGLTNEQLIDMHLKLLSVKSVLEQQSSSSRLMPYSGGFGAQISIFNSTFCKLLNYANGAMISTNKNYYNWRVLLYASDQLIPLWTPDSIYLLAETEMINGNITKYEWHEMIDGLTDELEFHLNHATCAQIFKSKNINIDELYKTFSNWAKSF